YKALTIEDTEKHRGKTFHPEGFHTTYDVIVSGSFADFKMAVSRMRAGFLGILFAALVLCASLLLSAPSEQKRVSIYSTAANYSLAVLDRDHRDYVSLLEVLEPLGTVTAKADGSRWKFRYNNVEAEFNAGKTR